MRVKIILFIIIPIFFLLITYHEIVYEFLKLWKSPTNGYCFFVPFIFFYLCWEKRKKFDFLTFSPSYFGIFLLFLSLLFSLMGRLASIKTFLYFGLYLSFLALAFTLYGKRCKYLFFPYLILIFSIPFPPFINRLLTFKLQLITSVVATQFIRFSGMSVFREGNILDIGITQLQVAEACSGLRYFMPMLLIALLISYYGLRSWWSYLIMLFSVLPISVLVNALRIFTIALFYNYNLKILTEEPYHSILGWIFFLSSGIFFILLILILKRIESIFLTTSKSKSLPEVSFKVSKPYFLIFLFCLITFIEGLILWKLPGIIKVPPKKDLLYFPLQFNKWQGKQLELSPEILKALWADDYFYGFYTREGSKTIIYLLIAYYNYQTTGHTAHTPQSCLLGGGWTILHSENRFLPLSANSGIKVKYLWLKKGEDKLLAAYFFFERGRVIISPWKHKFYLLWDALTRRRTDGALIRVEMLIPSELPFEKGEKELNNFIKSVWLELKNFIPE